MSDELLYFYEKELTFLRQSGAEFARAYPKIASRLRMSEDVVEDPHVSRLLEGVAYLNARVQKKIADDFPEISDALLDNLYPHYLRPLPSMAVVEFKPADDLDIVMPLQKGASLETDSIQGRPCTFQSTYDLEVLPLRVAQASFKGKPFATPGANEMKAAESVVHIRLKGVAEELDISALGLKKLRFYVRGQSQQAYPLYEALAHHCVGVVIDKGEGEFAVRPPHTLRDIGFEEEHGMIPYPEDSFPGYRLLTEYMAFPEKFLFVELSGLEQTLQQISGNELNIYIYVKRADTELERHISTDNVAINCVPIVNLFPHRAEPIAYEHTQDTYTVIPDARYPHHYEVYSVETVTGIRGDGNRVQYKPFYGLNHAEMHTDKAVYWHGQRQETLGGEHGNEPSSCIQLSLVDLNFDITDAQDETLSIETTCFNGNLPEKLPFGGGQPHLRCGSMGVGLKSIDTLTRITPNYRPPQGNGARWRLISQLSLNHLSLNGAEGTQYLREILALYDVVESSASKALINAIISIKMSTMTAPVTYQGKTTLCRGNEIEVTFDEALLSGNSVLLFASVLERFFAMYCSINSFTRMVARLKGKPEVLKKWPPRAGDRQLI
ncbi:type VI secretion system protein [Oleiphilus messinensis]|uniref:Type VI secretion system protein n=1 Tax=Oleiphilus messinensis TaxID=141451 RepID=A0A1Y0IE67_9GAMM|nr:type VI secretion system baseplate subunit TssF [Oleiphilus messinensis]ARU58818.1 type VI secretion system protein [Oleiphilus messinensis]